MQCCLWNDYQRENELPLGAFRLTLVRSYTISRPMETNRIESNGRAIERVVKLFSSHLIRRRHSVPSNSILFCSILFCSIWFAIQCCSTIRWCSTEQFDMAAARSVFAGRASKRVSCTNCAILAQLTLSEASFPHSSSLTHSLCSAPLLFATSQRSKGRVGSLVYH